MHSKNLLLPLLFIKCVKYFEKIVTITIFSQVFVTFIVYCEHAVGNPSVIVGQTAYTNLLMRH